MRPVPIDLEGEDLAPLLRGDDTVLPHGLLERLAITPQIVGICLVAELLEHVGRALELDGHHRVGRDQEAEDGGIVAGTEGAANQACAPVQRIAEATQAEGLGAGGGMPLEGVLVTDNRVGIRIEGRLGLLLENLDDGREGGLPAWGDEFGGAGALEELVAQGEEVSQGVQLVLAFEDLGWLVAGVYVVLLAVVGWGDVARWRRLKGVAVWCHDHILGLGVDRAKDQSSERLVVLR